MSRVVIPAVLKQARSAQLVAGPTKPLGALRFKGINVFSCVTPKFATSESRSRKWSPMQAFFIFNRNRPDYCFPTASEQRAKLRSAYQELSNQDKAKICTLINKKSVVIRRQLDRELRIRCEAKMRWVFYNKGSRRFASQFGNFFRFWISSNKLKAKFCRPTKRQSSWIVELSRDWEKMPPRQKRLFSLRPKELEMLAARTGNSGGAMYTRFVKKRIRELSQVEPRLTPQALCSRVGKEWRQLSHNDKLELLDSSFRSEFPLLQEKRFW